MADTRTLYDEDFIAWTEQQAEALRAAAGTGSNRQVDWNNLAEEVEDLGRSVRRELRSQLTRLTHHLLKLQYSPAEHPRRSWKSSIREARSEIGTLLSENPSLKGEVFRLAGEQLAEGIKLAAGDLQDYAELDPATEHGLRATRFTTEQLLGDWLPAEPSQRADDAP